MLRCILILIAVAQFHSDVSAETLLDVNGPRELWAIEVEPPSDDFLAAVIMVRSAVPEIKNVTLENLAIRGNLVQVWQDEPTALQPLDDQPLLPVEWLEFDSHLLIEPETVPELPMYFDISEANDASMTNIGLPILNGNNPTVGVGDIAMRRPTDVFFFFPEYQTTELALARVVTPKSDPDVRITLGVLGEGCIPNRCHEFQTFFDSVPVFVPEPSVTTQVIYILLFYYARRRRADPTRN